MVAYAFDAIARKSPLYFAGIRFRGHSIALPTRLQNKSKTSYLAKSAFKYLPLTVR